MSTEGSFSRIRYDVEGAVATITLARPEVANAQDYQMLSEITRALDEASADSAVRVIVLGADGRHFSAGHDLTSVGDLPPVPPVGNAVNFTAPGAEGYMDVEREFYLGYCKRWREVPKPTIARVQGRVIAGGVNLLWPMDLIVCADNASICDPVVTLGSNGAEYFTHPYEFGARLAKDMLFTGRTMSAEEALAHGVVQRVFPADDLVRLTKELADRIAEQPPFALAMAKRAVNFALDQMGYSASLEAAFAMHHVLHTHWVHEDGGLAPKGSEVAVRKVIKDGDHPGVLRR